MEDRSEGMYVGMYVVRKKKREVLIKVWTADVSFSG